MPADGEGSVLIRKLQYRRRTGETDLNHAVADIADRALVIAVRTMLCAEEFVAAIASVRQEIQLIAKLLAAVLSQIRKQGRSSRHSIEFKIVSKLK